MKNLILILLITFLTVSCANDESPQIDPYNTDLSTIEGTNATSPIEVTLTGVDGTVIDDFSELKPNTEYKIILSSPEAEFLRIKRGDGYELLKSPTLQSHEEGKSEYTILTTNDFSDQIYINVVAIHQNDRNLVRERPQSFLLPQ